VGEAWSACSAGSVSASGRYARGWQGPPGLSWTRPTPALEGDAILHGIQIRGGELNVSLKLVARQPAKKGRAIVETHF
jgi:hypothetical protein